MSFIKKIKDFFKQAPVESEIQETSTVKLKELPKKIESLSKSNKSNNLELKNKIEKRISQFSIDIKKNIEILEKIDLTERKEIESVKSRVLQNLDIYLSCLNNLIKEISNLEELDSPAYFNKIAIILNNFYKTSYKPYERATYLIGKEMASAKDCINKFTRDIDNLSKENKDFFEKTKKIENIFSLLKELRQSEKLEQDIKKDIDDFNLKILSMENEHSEIEEKITKMEESENYKKDLQEKKDYLDKRSKIDKELEEITKKIDYKTLANLFHNDNKKLKIIKNYLEDFKSTLIAEEEQKIIELVREAQNLDISSIKELKQYLMDLSPPILKTETDILNLSNRLGNIEYEKTTTKLNIDEDNKKQDKLAKKKEKTILDLKEGLTELGITLEEAS
jgi:hypothetical protein